MQLGIGYRPAFLGDPLGAKRRVAAHEALVLLAGADILFGAVVWGLLRRRRSGSGEPGSGEQRDGGRQANPDASWHGCAPLQWTRCSAPQPTIVNPPLTLNTWPVM
jgi:hypothetical protein